MGEIDLPKRPDGSYLDWCALFYPNDEQKLREYAQRIKETYKVCKFELEIENHVVLRFHRDYAMTEPDEIEEGILKYLIFDDGVDFLEDNIIGTICINENQKTFDIHIEYQYYGLSKNGSSVEKRGLATEIWKAAREIMKKLKIDCEGYDISTPVRQATEHLLDKYGNPFKKGTTEYSKNSSSSEPEL